MMFSDLWPSSSVSPAGEIRFHVDGRKLDYAVYQSLKNAFEGESALKTLE
jgi:hypothetical protein